MKNRKSGLFIIFLTVFIDLLGFGIIIPIVPFYLEAYFISPSDAGKVLGLLMTSFSLMQFIFAPILGRISDKIGRRPIILISLFLSGVTHLLFAVAPNLTWLFAARILTGIAAATVPTAMAYIADITPPSERARGMGLIGMAFGLGFVFGPAIGGIFSNRSLIQLLNTSLQLGLSESFISHNLLRIPIFFAGFLSFSSFLFAYFRLGESIKEKDQRKGRVPLFQLGKLIQAIKHPRLGILFTIFFLVTLSFTSLETLFAYLVERRFHFDSSRTGFLFAYIGIISATVQGVLIGKVSKKIGEKKIINFATLFLSITFFLIPFLKFFGIFLVVLGVMAASIGFNNPSVLSLISKNALADEQGGVLGLNQSFSALSRIIGPLFAGYLFDAFGEGIPFIVSSFLLFGAFILSLVLSRKKTGVHLAASNQSGEGYES